MATLKEKIKTEQRTREFLRSNGIQEPDAVEYGYTCIRFLFEESKVCLIIDIDEPPEEDGDELSDDASFRSAAGDDGP